ncbi:MAG: alpha/beta hydrolase [Candidatus Promineifilaceae bacterium]|nr:alpha/beta hydrolase [Candidatus Promineifilaceae bacterium]
MSEQTGYEDLKDEFVRQMRFSGFKRALLATVRGGAITGAEAAYERVGRQDIPVILFWGQADQVVPFELSERVLDLIPDAKFYAIAGAGHVPHFERPEVVNPLLVDFLTD